MRGVALNTYNVDKERNMVFKAYLRLIPSYMGVAVMYMAMFGVLLGMTMMGRSGLN